MNVKETTRDEDHYRLMMSVKTHDKYNIMRTSELGKVHLRNGGCAVVLLLVAV